MARPKSQWELDYCRRQADINRWAREHYRPRLVEMEKIRIYPPGECPGVYRVSPCTGCKAKTFCDIPCRVYLQWYNRRLEIARIRAGR